MKARHPFTRWTPMPDGIWHDLAASELLHHEVCVLACLYRRGRFNDFVVEATLEQIADWSNWPRRLDTLSKCLRKLRSKGWIDYRSRPGRHRYRIALCRANHPS